MYKNPQVEIDRPAVAELMADVATAVAGRGAAVSQDVYEAILQEIPQLRDDKPVLTLLASSVDSNVDTCLQIMQRGHAEHVPGRGWLHRPDFGGDGRRLRAGARELAAEPERRAGRADP